MWRVEEHPICHKFIFFSSEQISSYDQLDDSDFNVSTQYVSHVVVQEKSPKAFSIVFFAYSPGTEIETEEIARQTRLLLIHSKSAELSSSIGNGRLAQPQSSTLKEDEK